MGLELCEKIRVEILGMIERSRRFDCFGGRACGRVFKKRVVGVLELPSLKRCLNRLACQF